MGAMDDAERLEPGTLEEWGEWLRAHHEQPTGVWLVSSRKAPERAFSYEEAVVEALRFGWVDSTVKPVDERRSMQWFSPRRAGSMWTLMDDVEDLVVPDDLAAAFDRHPGSREHWDSWSGSARKLILTWIVLAKRPETRASRVETTAEKAAHGEKSQG